MATSRHHHIASIVDYTEPEREIMRKSATTCSVSVAQLCKNKTVTYSNDKWQVHHIYAIPIILGKQDSTKTLSFNVNESIETNSHTLASTLI